MTEEKKSYYAIIPATVRYDKTLNANSKLLYGEITALCNEKGYCWASNSYFANLYEVSNTSISLWIKRLKERGYIKVELKYKEGSKEILYRYITLIIEGMQEKLKPPIQEKLKDNITVYNNTNNNTFNKDDNYRNMIDGFTESYKTIYNKDFIWKNQTREFKAIKDILELEKNNPKIRDTLKDYFKYCKDNPNDKYYQFTPVKFITNINNLPTINKTNKIESKEDYEKSVDELLKIKEKIMRG